MACPFFLPTERIDDGGWIHPSRLPLGSGWAGRCTAPGHENEVPSDRQIRECCNLGYAITCSFRPAERESDSVRFAVVKESEEQVTVCYVCERDHRPANHGTLEFDKKKSEWRGHADGRIQKMAQCYLSSYLLRKLPGIAGEAAST